MTKRKILLIIALTMCIFFSAIGIYAEDNVDSGSDSSQKAIAGYYRNRDCMYKVSIYIGKKFNTRAGEPSSSYHLVGKPIFLARSDFKSDYGDNLFCGNGNKLEYHAGKNIQISKLKSSQIHFQANVPAIPIINGGNLAAVKGYFGDTETLKVLLYNVALELGTTEGALLTSKTYYDINGAIEKLKAEELLPIKDANGKYKNKRPFLVVYEPISVGYLTDKKTALAFTATEYAMLQKAGELNFFTKKLGNPNIDAQLMWGLTHRDLPNSLFLEESWVGIPARAEIKNRKRTNEWSKALIESVNDKIISGSGIGMRYLKASAELLGPPNQYESINIPTYRTDIDVITSLKVSVPASGNRIDTFYPGKPATVTFEINGEKKEHKIILPDGGSQLAWVKWKTPIAEGNVHIRATCSSGLFFSDGSTIKDIYAKVVKFSEKTPVDPKPEDTASKMKYKAVPLPAEAETLKNTWGEYFAVWHEHWVDRGDFKKNPDGTKVIPEEWIPNLKDEGWWDWKYVTYEAKLGAEVKILPSDETPTGKKLDNTSDSWKIKSGYGIKIEVKPIFTTDAPSSDHYASNGNVITFFPEFGYKNYFRMLEKNGVKFRFQKNKYSHSNARVHFTPLWFPDGDYTVYSEVVDYWTPAGMLKTNKSERIIIEGDVYDDWLAVPAQYQR